MRHYFSGADYKFNKRKAKQVLIKLINSDLYKNCTAKQKKVILHIFRNIMASPNFTDFQSSRKAAAEIGISKSFYCKTRQLMLKSELFIEYQHHVNAKRIQLLIRPLGLKGDVALVKRKHPDHDYFYSRIFKFKAMEDGEFIAFLNSGRNENSSKTGLVPDSHAVTISPLPLANSSAIFTNFLPSTKIPMNKYGILRKLKPESRPKVDENADIGVYLQGGLVCLDVDDAEVYQVLTSILPDKVLKQKNLVNGHGHIIVRDRKNLLRGFSKIGKIDVLSKNRAVRIKCDDYEPLNGELVDVDLETVNNILLFCGNGERLISAKSKKSKAKVSSFDGTATETMRVAENLLNVLRGQDVVRYRFEQGTRNLMLLKALSCVRAKGYNADVITKAAELFGSSYIDGVDDKATGTLKSVLRGKNKYGFVQHIEIFSKGLEC